MMVIIITRNEIRTPEHSDSYNVATYLYMYILYMPYVYVYIHICNR